jgi:Flp pilus assembly protein TadG
MNGCLSKLGQLGRDDAGNTLAIAAASLIPLMALIGGGVDVSRAYMAKTQLQSACDAGVLAGRKALSKSGSYGDNEKAKANSMFNFNFNSNALDVKNVAYTTDDNDDGQVLGTATATLPTLIMKIFDRETVELSVDCMAELQIGNADIMFVLDTTGSMADPINWGEPSKMAGLRDAVRDFHKTINQAVNDNRTRIRYGFVPYSMTINVGGLLANGDMPVDYLADESRYQTRLARFATPVNITDYVEDLGYSYETYGSNISSTNCNYYGDNRYPSWSGQNPVKTGTPPSVVTSKEYDFYSWTKAKNSNNGTCVRRVWTTKTYYDVEYQFTNWIYQEAPVDTSTFKAGTATSYASGITSTTNPLTSSRTEELGAWDPVALAKKAAAGTAHNITLSTTSTNAWNGCIEERQTETPDTTYDFDPIPEEALDLNLDLEPTDDDSAWKPMWGTMMLDRSSTSPVNYYYNTSNSKWYLNSSYSGSSYNNAPTSSFSNACPAQMMLLRSVELSDDPDDVPTWLNTYVNNLNPTGNTYHDIGMIWGGRLTSPSGLFADNVNLDADKINVSRHIIFMTDGIMQPTASGWSAYGVEDLDHRIAPIGYEGTITGRHTARFSAICEAVKAQGTTIWVVAFGTSMTTALQDCATDGRAYYSSNSEQLRNTFKYIAAQVADLRLGA